MKTPPVSNQICSWEPINCSPTRHILITLLVASILASLALLCYFYSIGGKITPALLGVSSAFSIVFSVILIPFRAKKLLVSVPESFVETSEVFDEKPQDSFLEKGKLSRQISFDDLEGTPPITPPMQPSPPKPNFGVPTTKDRSFVTPRPIHIITEETIITIYGRIKSFEELNSTVKKIQNLKISELPDPLKFTLLIEVCQEKNKEKQKISSRILEAILPSLSIQLINAQCVETGNTPLHIALTNNLEAAMSLASNANINLILFNIKKEGHLQLAARTMNPALIQLIFTKLSLLPDAQKWIHAVDMLTHGAVWEVNHSSALPTQKKAILQLLMPDRFKENNFNRPKT